MDYKYTNFNVPNIIGKDKATDKQEKIDLSHSFNHYNTLKEQSRPFIVEFSHADKDGNLSTIVEGIEIFMPYEYISEEETEEERRYQRADRLINKYEVTVKEVDEENRRVTVEYKGNRIKQRQAIIHKINDMLRQEKATNAEITKEADAAVTKMRLKIVDDINASGRAIEPRTLHKMMQVKKHQVINQEYAKRGINRIIVDAVVKKVFADGAMIDIKGYGIAGYIPCYYFNYTYISDLSHVVHEGDIISVVIIGYTNRISKEAVNTAKTNIPNIYLCARTPLIDNPWEKITFEKGDIVKITCTEIERSHWYGTIPGYEMEIYCEYPDNESGNLRIIKGQTYECFIKKIDKERLLVTAKPFIAMVDRHE